MRFIASTILAAFTAVIAITSISAQPPATSQPKGTTSQEYVKKGNRADTVRATLASFGLPNLEGNWYYIGPFDNEERGGFDFAYPPEKAIDLKATYPGKGGQKAAWKAFSGFKPGTIVDLTKLFPNDKLNAVAYLYHTFDSAKAFKLRLSLGSDDTLSVFFNGKRLLHEPYFRAAAADQDFVDVSVKEGKNELLIKICQEGGDWAAYVNPAELPTIVPETIRQRLEKEFPVSATASSAPSTN